LFGVVDFQFLVDEQGGANKRVARSRKKHIYKHLLVVKDDLTKKHILINNIAITQFIEKAAG
jgi:hypothetical protein